MQNFIKVIHYQHIPYNMLILFVFWAHHLSHCIRMNFGPHSSGIAVKNKVYIVIIKMFCCTFFYFNILSVGSEFLCHSLMFLKCCFTGAVTITLLPRCHRIVTEKYGKIGGAKSVPNPCDVLCYSALDSHTHGPTFPNMFNFNPSMDK